MTRGELLQSAIGALLACLIPTGSAQHIAVLERRAAVIKPSADELRWKRIPWVLDLGEGQRVAQVEKRPIFLWVTGDDPLERC